MTEKNMKTTLLIILLSGAFVGATTTQSITGGITDSTCGASHSMMKGMPMTIASICASKVRRITRFITARPSES